MARYNPETSFWREWNEKAVRIVTGEDGTWLFKDYTALKKVDRWDAVKSCEIPRELAEIDGLKGEAVSLDPMDFAAVDCGESIWFTTRDKLVGYYPRENKFVAYPVPLAEITLPPIPPGFNTTGPEVHPPIRSGKSPFSQLFVDSQGRIIFLDTTLGKGNFSLAVLKP